MQTLDIDWGNTRLKWRVSDAQHIYGEGASEHEDAALQDIASRFPSVARTRVASVRKRSDCEVLESLINKCFTSNVEFAHSASSTAGLINSYSCPDNMGVDRWCGMLAVRENVRSHFVLVSLGTALTLDFVRADGHHVGGYIVPGLYRQIAMLTSQTGRVFVDGDIGERSKPVGLQPADNTSDAVVHGVMAGLLALITTSCEKFRRSVAGEQVVIVLTGGDAARFEPLLGDDSFQSKNTFNDVRMCQGLVLDGLRILLP